ncbi:right-handed parallel beta-helix repeat-containing protein [Paenibacillus whitsoniae]|uniref:Probable pectate lyase C n=1 Tax=Paenibacillus whitsoniae TaxID=2496558 RepID=A0A430JI49_9BACL|nr:right-handed parallel beta-helix repeat-containing protein [Paenibacillus whitsoniae]RTE10672.1 hypothetical protein EJQ19_05205 [Paenibacillus whitsoniae]
MLANRIRKEIVLLFMVCLGVIGMLALSHTAHAAGVAYYVDASDGNDNNDGLSSEGAWRTITKVNSVSLQPGDQVLFKSGQTWQGVTLRPIASGTSSDPIRFGAYGDPSLAQPVISGAARADSWVGPDANGEYKQTGLTGDALRIVMLEDGKRLTGNHIDARLQGPTIGSLTPGSFVADSVTGSVYYKPSTGTLNDHVIEVAKKNGTFAFSSNGKNYLILDGIDFRGGYDFVMFIGTGSHHVTIKNSSIHGVDRAGVRISGASDIQLLNNEIYDMNYFGIALEGGASNNVISGNHVHGIGLLDTDDGDTVGIQIVGGAAGANSKQNTIEKNEIDQIGRDIYKGKGGTSARGNLYHAGILVDSSTETIIQQNHIHDVYRSGILIFTSSADATNTSIHHNLIHHAGKVTSTDYFNSGIYLNTKLGLIDGTTVYNNTIASSRFKADVVNREAAVFIRVQGKTVPGAYGALHNVAVVNNVIAGNEGNYMMSFHADNEAAISGLTIDHNLYARSDANAGGVYWNQGGTEKIYKANQMFGASTSYSVEKNQDLHAIMGDPLFMDTSQPNYALQPISPAIDAGANVGLAVDFLGNPIPAGDAPDIGAYEEQHPFIPAPVVTGVMNGQVYGSVVAATYDRGEAWLTRNGDTPIAYLSGTPIAQSGVYELRVTYRSQTTIVGFTIDTAAPVVTGVVDGQLYTGDVTPVFNKGRGMLYRLSTLTGERQTETGTYEIVSTVDAPDGKVDKEVSEWATEYLLSPVTLETEILVNPNFLSGTVIHDPGFYRLTVTDDVYNVTQVSFQIQAQPDPGTDPTAALVLTGPMNVRSGEDMVLTAGLKDVLNVSALEFSVVYDPERLEYVSAQSARSGIQIVQEQQQAAQGKIHLVLAGLGSSNAISGAASVVELKFTAKETSVSSTSGFAAQQVKIATGQGVETNVGAASYTIQILGHVNKEELIARIAAGEALMQGAVEGYAIGSYFPGTLALRGPGLTAALLAAQAIVQSDNAAQAEVDAALQALEAAISYFESARILTETGNINGQPGITVGDLAIVAYYYGSTTASSNWSEAQVADVDHDGVVGMSDMAFMAARISGE